MKKFIQKIFNNFGYVIKKVDSITFENSKKGRYIAGDINTRYKDWDQSYNLPEIDTLIDIYNNENSEQKKYTLILNVKDSIESSLLANSIRKIEMSINYKIIEKNSNIILLKDSFSRNSLVGPINSLFSRDQSEINARKRLGISISNDMIIRLIEWASFDLEA